VISFLASVANIGRFHANNAGLFLKIRAKVIVTTAQLAIFYGFPTTLAFANMVFCTARSANTGIV